MDSPHDESTSAETDHDIRDEGRNDEELLIDRILAFLAPFLWVGLIAAFLNLVIFGLR